MHLHPQIQIPNAFPAYVLCDMQVAGWTVLKPRVCEICIKELAYSEQLNHHGSTVLRDDEFKLAFIALIWQ
jgi:hypothetical protein